ncbi:hypothetical protein KFK09_016716 [Dendrobium nobile]|uniref:Uncharacterized protein n=1 Tax=Dendrobium nobile TaxID=94219 RepID=A0A8T3B098_DENNO|nr:hypothetical protein KFK09_016716 [Dendrobium nobile]
MAKPSAATPFRGEALFRSCGEARCRDPLSRRSPFTLSLQALAAKPATPTRSHGEVCSRSHVRATRRAIESSSQVFELDLN